MLRAAVSVPSGHLPTKRRLQPALHLLQSPHIPGVNPRRIRDTQLMAFGDIHDYLHTLPTLEAALRQADLILVTGDMTRWRGPQTAAKVLDAIAHYNPQILAQVGNTDSWDTH